MTPSKSLGSRRSSELHSSAEHWQQFKTGDFGEKWSSSKLIVKEGRRAITPLLELLQDSSVDAETHWFTIRALGSFPEPQVIKAISAQIGPACQYDQRTAEQAIELSNFAIETLAAMGSLAINVLIDLLQSPQKRLLAAKALNQIRSTGVIPAMVAISQDEDAAVRYYAIDALGSFHSPVVTPVLFEALKDSAASVRKAAVMALGRRFDLQESYQLSQQLQPLLWDLDVTVCCQAALALGRLKAEDMVETLQQVLVSPHTPLILRLDIVRALAWCCDSINSDGPVSPDLFQSAHPKAYEALLLVLDKFASPLNDAEPLLPPEDNQKVLVAVVQVLGNLPALTDTSTPHLIELLQKQPAALSVIQSTIMALASLAHAQSFEALLSLLHHQEEAIPIYTIAALKRLDPDHSLRRVRQYLNQFPDLEASILELW